MGFDVNGLALKGQSWRQRMTTIRDLSLLLLTSKTASWVLYIMYLSPDNPSGHQRVRIYY